MSRHSKWAKIKRAKGITDVKRGQLFTKLASAITAAARAGGADPDMNPHLRLALDRALAANMPKETATRALERATSTLPEGATAVVLEGYGPGGTALLMDVVTDNRNRTVSDVRRMLNKVGGSLGESGSVAWQFERQGVLDIENARDPEAVELAAIDAGATNIEREGQSVEISTPPEKLAVIADVLSRQGFPPTSAALVNVPKQWLAIDPSTFNTLARLVEELEDREDVVEVTTNAAPPRE